MSQATSRVPRRLGRCRLSARFAAAVICSALALVLGATPARAQQLEVHVLDVGQGLSVFIQSPTGTRFLVDASNPGDGTSIVKPYLQAHGVAALDSTLMTHWHTDHFGGLTDLFTAGYKPLVAAYDRGDTNKPSNSFVTQYMSAVAGKRQIATIGQLFDLGGGATLQVMAINGQWIGGSLDPTASSQEENSRSMALVLRYGDFDCYIGGDCTANADGSTVNVEGPATAVIGQVEVAVAAHHGSNTSSSSAVVTNLNPSLVIESAGLDNSYGHPTKTTINRWCSPSAARVQWCTSAGDTTNGAGGFSAIDGHILITSDGSRFTASRSSGSETIDFTTVEQPVTLAGVGQLAINEVLVDPLASLDAYGEWFEILNKAGLTLDLAGVRCSCGASTFTNVSHVLLDPGERFVIGVDGRASRNGNLFTGLGAPWESFSLANGSSSLTVRTSTGVTIEQALWGSGGFPAVPGASAERIQAANPPIASNFATAITAWSGSDLGTPWAINDNDPAACPQPVPYGTGKLTSIGTLPVAGWSGTPSLYTNDFAVVLTGGVPNKACIAFYGPNQGSIPFYGGTLYIAPPIKRLHGQTLDPSGSTSFLIPIDAGMLGTDTNYQCWFRDPLAPDGTKVGLSSALAVHWCPSSSTPPPTGPGSIIVSEIMKDPAFVLDSNGEWFELYNTTAQPIDIDGWLLRDDGIDSHVINTLGLGLVIQPGQQVVLGINSNAGANGGIAVAYQYSNFLLANSSDEIVLEDLNGVEIDRVNYAGSPWPNTSGRSLNLNPSALDGTLNDDPANWCTATTQIGGGNTDRGTPNQPNDACP
jgi:beta-lactamase superfamily II metal-dependent hydrolase